MKTLYHYTSRDTAEQIIRLGMIRIWPIASCMFVGHALWLTSDGELKHDHGLPPEKRRVRFTVKLPTRDVEKLHDWVRRHGGDAAVSRELMRPAGSRAAHTWRVIERPITWPRWVEATDLSTGELLFEAPRGGASCLSRSASSS